MFVCDFIAIVKFCEGDVYWMYYANQFYFQGDVFGNFHALFNFANESISLWWIIDLNTTYHLAFDFARQHVRAKYVKNIRAFNFVTRHVYEKVVASMK